MGRYDFLRPNKDWNLADAEAKAKIELNITYSARRPEGFRSYLLLTQTYTDCLGFAVIKKAILDSGDEPGAMQAAWLKWRMFEGENFNAAA